MLYLVPYDVYINIHEHMCMTGAAAANVVVVVGLSYRRLRIALMRACAKFLIL